MIDTFPVIAPMEALLTLESMNQPQNGTKRAPIAVKIP